MLRAKSEASDLRRVSDRISVGNPFSPLIVPGAIGLVNDVLVIRLSARKSRFGGDSISRACVCVNPGGGIRVYTGMPMPGPRFVALGC